jgi:hypothetical protein
MTLASHVILFKIHLEAVLFADLLHAGETPARDTPLDLEACLSSCLAVQPANESHYNLCDHGNTISDVLAHKC